MTDVSDTRDPLSGECRCENRGSRLIGIAEHGRIVKFSCPFCGETWSRDDNKD